MAAAVHATLALVHDRPGARLLLGWKKRGFGKDKFNGFGGKVEASDASVLAAAARELKEEAGIECPDLEARAVVEFSFDDGGKTPDIVMYVFLGSRVVGEPVESSEMRPQWFETERIPFEQMWADDRLWLPWLLAGKRFRGRFAFAADHITILNYELVSDAVADIALPA